MLTKTQSQNVIAFLRQNYTLPEKGLVAGQAVASLIYKELGLNLLAPINDVDVFTETLRSAPKIRYDEKRFGAISTHSFKGSMGDLTSSTTFNRAYRILRSYMSKEDQAVNIVEIKKSSKYVNKQIVDSFDLNCCSVGFDIETEEFVYSSAFEEFIKTKQLRVQSIHTPFHTWLRLNKKMQDLGSVYCDLDLEHFVLIQGMQINYSYYGSFIVGDRFYELLEKYKDNVIEKLFHETDFHDSEVNKDYKRIEFDQTFLTSDLFLNQIKRDSNPSTNKLSELLSNLYYHEKENAWGINAVSATNLIHLMFKTDLFNQKYVNKVLSLFEEMGYTNFNKTLVLTLLEKRPLVKLKGDLPFQQLKRISKMLKEHINLINVFESRRNEDLSFEEIIEHLEYLYPIVKKDKQKLFLIGLLEINNVSLKDVVAIANEDIETIIDKLIDNKTQEKMQSKLLFKNNEFHFAGVRIKQLSTVSDFYESGAELQNCLLGHFNQWSHPKSDSRYFILEYKGKKSAIRTEYGEVKEHSGFQNKWATFMEKEISNLLMIYILIKDGANLQPHLKRYIKGKFNDFLGKRLNKYAWWRKAKRRVSFGTFDDEIPF